MMVGHRSYKSNPGIELHLAGRLVSLERSQPCRSEDSAIMARYAHQGGDLYRRQGRERRFMTNALVRNLSRLGLALLLGSVSLLGVQTKPTSPVPMQVHRASSVAFGANSSPEEGVNTHILGTNLTLADFEANVNDLVNNHL